MKLNLGKWKELTVKQKIVRIVIGFFVFVIISNLINGPRKSPTSPTSTQLATPVKQITYEVIKKWDIPNGGEGKVVVISPDYLNRNDMPIVGEKLKSDNKNDRNSFIFVFTDKKAAEMRDRVLSDGVDKLTEEEQDYYDARFVAEYTKNANSGYHKFVIHYDGILGSDTQEIKY